MKRIFVALLAGLLVTSAHADPLELRKVDLISVNPKEIYAIAQDEITPKTALVKRIEIGKGSVIVTYSNSTAKSAQPKFSMRLFNAYGMEIGRVRVSWTFASLKPGELKQETEGSTFPTSSQSSSTLASRCPATGTSPSMPGCKGRRFSDAPNPSGTDYPKNRNRNHGFRGWARMQRRLRESAASPDWLVSRDPCHLRNPWLSIFQMSASLAT
jgi:hypothetical protein